MNETEVRHNTLFNWNREKWTLREPGKTIDMTRLSKINRPSMVSERMNGNEYQIATAAADIIIIEYLQYWARHNLQELLNEINQIRQYHDDTVTSHNELIDQLQASVKGVKTLKQELQDLGNDYEKQTDGLPQTQSQLDQA